jgi:hypothetical protein
MKIIIVITAVIILIALIAVFSGVFSTPNQTQEIEKVTKKLTTTPASEHTAGNEISTTTTTTTSQPLAANPPVATSPAGDNVKFDFTLDDISGSGLSRTITAKLTNLGPGDAHNVWGKMEGFSKETRVKLNGKENIRIDVGTLKGGAAITRQLTLSFSLSDGLKILQNGARFVFTVYSDEHTQAMPHDFKP